MNSLKSVCSFAKGAPVTFNEFEQDLQSCRRREVCVVLIVSTISVLKTVKNLGDSLHEESLSRSRSDAASAGLPRHDAGADLDVPEVDGDAHAWFDVALDNVAAKRDVVEATARSVVG